MAKIRALSIVATLDRAKLVGDRIYLKAASARPGLDRR
jgi:hypothetical protein